MSGGISDVVLENISFYGTDCGFRIKSAYPRKGYIRNIKVQDLYMQNVRFPVHIQLNWNVNYNVCTIGENYHGEIPEHWKTIMAPVSDSIPPTELKNLCIQNITAELTEDYDKISQAFVIDGYAQDPIKDITMNHLKITCNEYGMIRNIAKLSMNDVNIKVTGGSQEERDTYDNT